MSPKSRVRATRLPPSELKSIILAEKVSTFYHLYHPKTASRVVSQIYITYSRVRKNKAEPNGDVDTMMAGTWGQGGTVRTISDFER